MKRNLIALFAAGAVCATSALNAEIVLAEDLSLSGYIDLYASGYDGPGDTSETGLAEFETAFAFNTEPFSALVELSYDGTDASFEDAYVTYTVDDNLSFSAGNIFSYLGFEGQDAPDLYQFSYAYRDFTSILPGWAVGAAMDYATDVYSFGIWVGDADDSDISVEVAGSYSPVEGLTLFAGYANDPGYETINFWVSYEYEGWTFAAEIADVDNDDMYSYDNTAYLFMANYAYENYGITFRYSVQEDEMSYDSSELEDWNLFTISPSYVFSDNLAGLCELSFIDDGGDMDYAWAFELVYTF
ncbi:MAG: hypothetical protein AB3N63_08200 [Puniceicoccaceae bacterium]